MDVKLAGEKKLVLERHGARFQMSRLPHPHLVPVTLTACMHPGRKPHTNTGCCGVGEMARHWRRSHGEDHSARQALVSEAERGRVSLGGRSPDTSLGQRDMERPSRVRGTIVCSRPRDSCCAWAFLRAPTRREHEHRMAAPRLRPAGPLA